MGFNDDFESLMENCEIGDFSAFMLSEEEVEAGKKERKEQVEKDTAELRQLMKEVDELKKEGKNIPNKTIRRVKQLSSDKLVLIAAMEDVDVDELVEMEMGDSKKENHAEHVDKTAEMIDILKKSLESENPMETLERLTSVKEEPVEEESPIAAYVADKNTSIAGNKVKKGWIVATCGEGEKMIASIFDDKKTPVKEGFSIDKDDDFFNHASLIATEGLHDDAEDFDVKALTDALKGVEEGDAAGTLGILFGMDEETTSSIRTSLSSGKDLFQALDEVTVCSSLYYEYREADKNLGTPNAIILADPSKYNTEGIHYLNDNTTNAIEKTLSDAGIDVVEMMECVYEIPGISEEKILDVLSAHFTLSKIPN